MKAFGNKREIGRDPGSLDHDFLHSGALLAIRCMDLWMMRLKGCAR